MRRRLLCVIIAAVAMVGAAVAGPIGTLDFAGLGVMRISATEIDFSPLGGGTGDFVVTGVSGVFLALPLGALGEITDLDIVTAPPGAPLGTPVDPFVVVPVPGSLFSFSLGQIPLGGGPSCVPAPAVGQSCTPTEVVPNSPFLLTQNAGAVTASFTVRGTLTDLSDSSTAPYAGLFTMNFTQPGADTVAEVLSSFGPLGPGFVESSWSAQFNAAVPEPGTLLVVGGALLMLPGFLRRRSKT